MSGDSVDSNDGGAHRDGEEPLLSIRDLRTHFETESGLVRAVDGVSFDVRRGETVCLVGESGSGKSVTVESITGLVPTPPGRIAGGEIRFDGRTLHDASAATLRRVRGDRIGHVFQDPRATFNPVYTVGAQLREAICAHQDLSPRAARSRAIALLETVRIPDPATRVEDYPHEFSTGQLQRIAIAMAIACDPDLLIADEPTTALDVTVEAAILDLLRELQERLGMALLLVTHDFGVVADVADRVVVCYAGQIVETAPVLECFDAPAHPYTRALLECYPGRAGDATPIDGSLPDPVDPPAGCRFAPRCPHAVAACTRENGPSFHEVAENHLAACVYYGDGFDAGALEDRDDRRRGADSS